MTIDRPNTATVTAVLAYGLIEIFGSVALAMIWRRNSARSGARRTWSPC